MAAPQDANVLMFGLLKQITNLVGILTTQLKSNEVATSGSTGVKVVKRLSIKIPPQKAFEGEARGGSRTNPGLERKLDRSPFGDLPTIRLLSMDST